VHHFLAGRWLIELPSVVVCCGTVLCDSHVLSAAILSLILERESLAAMIGAITITLFLVLVRFLLRGYGEKHLGIHSVRISQRLCNAYQAFLSTASQRCVWNQRRRRNRRRRASLHQQRFSCETRRSSFGQAPPAAAAFTSRKRFPLVLVAALEIDRARDHSLLVVWRRAALGLRLRIRRGRGLHPAALTTACGAEAPSLPLAHQFAELFALRRGNGVAHGQPVIDGVWDFL
jgi:hypothetical protein